MNVESLRTKGNEYFQKNLFFSAIECYTYGLQQKEDYILYSNRATAYFKLNKLEESIKDAKKSIELNSHYSKSHLRLYLCYQEQGNWVEAEKSLRNLINCDYKNMKYKESLLELRQKLPKTKLKNENNNHEIVEMMDGPIKVLAPLDFAFNSWNLTNISPKNDYDKAMKQGEEFFKASLYEEALTCFDMASKWSPDDPLSVYKKSSAYFKLGLFKQSREMLLNALQLLQSDIILSNSILYPKVLCKLAFLQSFFNISMIDDYIQIIDRALDLVSNPKFREQSLRLVPKLIDIQLYMLSIKKNQARNDALENAIYYNNLAIELFQDLEFEEAIEKWTIALSYQTNNPILLSNRSFGYLALRKCNHALFDLDRALKFEPTKFRIEKKAVNHYYLYQFKSALKCYRIAQTISGNSYLPSDFIARINFYLENCGSNEKMVRNALCDPEVLKVLNNPYVLKILNAIQTDPSSAGKLINNKKILNDLTILRESGLISFKLNF